MRNVIKICLIVIVSCVLGAVCSWFFLSGSSVSDDAEVLRERHIAKTTRSGNVKKVTEISVSRKSGKRSIRIVESEEPKPELANPADIDDEDQLTEVQRSVLDDIQKALDADDFKALKKALSRFTAKASRGGLGGYANVPRVVRSAAVQALGWFGGKAAVDLVDFMADSDEDISSDAFNQFEMALQDAEMSDYERSVIVKTTSKALVESERIDTLLSTLDDMRNSVKGDTVIAILTEGSEQSKAAMQEQMEFYLDDGVKTVDDVKKWLAENPDDPDDNEFYGGSKEE